MTVRVSCGALDTGCEGEVAEGCGEVFEAVCVADAGADCGACAAGASCAIAEPENPAKANARAAKGNAFVRMIAGLPRNPRLLPVLAIPAQSPMVRAAILCPKCTRTRAAPKERPCAVNPCLPERGEPVLYFLARPSRRAFLPLEGWKSGPRTRFRAREVGLSQSVAELLVFGSTNAFALVKSV
jgi:hypothetical protein